MERRHAELLQKEMIFGLTDEEQEELENYERQSQKEYEMQMAWQEIQEVQDDNYIFRSFNRNMFDSG